MDHTHAHLPTLLAALREEYSAHGVPEVDEAESAPAGGVEAEAADNGCEASPVQLKVSFDHRDGAYVVKDGSQTQTILRDQASWVLVVETS